MIRNTLVRVRLPAVEAAQVLGYSELPVRSYKPRPDALLVVWYLMLPVRPDGSANADAPLSKWKTSNRYDRADECKKVLLGLRSGWVGYANGHELNCPSQKDTAACIATDDPRLKEK
jgi:hypothetical protein